LREKIDWCSVGEVSALYDVLLVSDEPRLALVARVDKDELMSFRGGGVEIGCW
jgi:hypothetical protein